MKRRNSTLTDHKRNIKNWLRRLFLAVVGLIFGVELYMANAKVILGNQLPMPFGIGVANVLSGSMEPTFSKGTLLIIKKSEDYQVGDIVVYQSGPSLVVHRVIELDGDTVVTRGDANNASDTPFDRAEVKGVVVGWIPYLGEISSLMKTPTGFIVVLLGAFLVMEGSFRKQQEEDNQELDAIKDEIRRLKDEMQDTKDKAEEDRK